MHGIRYIASHKWSLALCACNRSYYYGLCVCMCMHDINRRGDVLQFQHLTRRVMRPSQRILKCQNATRNLNAYYDHREPIWDRNTSIFGYLFLVVVVAAVRVSTASCSHDTGHSHSKLSNEHRAVTHHECVDSDDFLLKQPRICCLLPLFNWQCRFVRSQMRVRFNEFSNSMCMW